MRLRRFDKQLAERQKSTHDPNLRKKVENNKTTLYMDGQGYEIIGFEE